MVGESGRKCRPRCVVAMSPGRAALLKRGSGEARDNTEEKYATLTLLAHKGSPIRHQRQPGARQSRL